LIVLLDNEISVQGQTGTQLFFQCRKRRIPQIKIARFDARRIKELLKLGSLGKLRKA
jgi:hypothetical protein